jgi:hypothetical protein
MLPPFIERNYGTQLLRTCRQIYIETALLPYRTNTFIFTTHYPVKQDIRYMKPFQRAQIEKIQFETSSSVGDTNPLDLSVALGKDNLEVIPGLKHIHVVAFCDRGHDPRDFSEQMKSVKAVVNDVLNVQLAGRQLKSTCEVQSGGDKFDHTKR